MLRFSHQLWRSIRQEGTLPSSACSQQQRWPVRASNGPFPLVLNAFFRSCKASRSSSAGPTKSLNVFLTSDNDSRLMVTSACDKTVATLLRFLLPMRTVPLLSWVLSRSLYLKTAYSAQFRRVYFDSQVIQVKVTESSCLRHSMASAPLLACSPRDMSLTFSWIYRLRGRALLGVIRT